MEERSTTLITVSLFWYMCEPYDPKTPLGFIAMHECQFPSETFLFSLSCFCCNGYCVPIAMSSRHRRLPKYNWMNFILFLIDLIYLSTYFHHHDHHRCVVVMFFFTDSLNRTEHILRERERKNSISISIAHIQQLVESVRHQLVCFVRAVSMRSDICMEHLLCSRTHDRPINLCSPICHRNLEWKDMHVPCTHHDRCCRIRWSVNSANAWLSV